MSEFRTEELSSIVSVTISASESDASYSYCITLQDGTKFYFTAQCMSFKTRIGGVDDITGATTSLEIDNDILEVFPA